MENFVVSARKYRPQNFSTVVGQSHITTTLKNAIKNNQLAHAFLFCGPRGVGKTTCARILAKTINCENRTPDIEACNVCQSCVSFDRGTSMNIHELDAASNNSVEDIRSLVEQVRFAPQAGKYKVYIVDEVHMLSASAFNAFLKTLEEPPPYAIFILATTEKHKILPTILSRCQIFDFKRITNRDTVEHLKEICEKENIIADKASLDLIAQKSEGCLRDSLSILDKIVSFTNGSMTYSNTLEHLNILDEDYYFRLLEFMQSQKLSEAILLFDEINKKGFEGDMLINGFAEFLRNVLISRDEKTVSLLEVTESFKTRYLHAAQSADPSWILSALNLLNEGELNYKQARNKRLLVEMLIIKLTYLNQALVLNGANTKSSKSIAFKAIPQIILHKEIKTESNKAKLIIETKSPIATVTTVKTPAIKLSEPIVQAETEVPSQFANVRLSKLEKIKNELIQKNKLNKTTAKEVNEEEIYVAWGAYIQKLEERNNPSAITNFRAAQLKVVDPNSIEIIVSSNFQLKFIENERAALIDHFQAHFNNKFLTYKVVVVETNEPKEAEIHLNSKQQYLKMIEEYPLVKELKDRLKLQLDY
ncbi:MAG: DNA polymerase III subunit gamma/tau [Ginsengibacter sp.]